MPYNKPSLAHISAIQAEAFLRQKAAGLFQSTCRGHAKDSGVWSAMQSIATCVRLYRHSPQAEDFQKIVEDNLLEVRADYMQAALNNLSSSDSAEGRNQAAETYLKTPRPVEVGAAPFCLLRPGGEFPSLQHAFERLELGLKSGPGLNHLFNHV